MKKNNKGFTLIELIAIIILLGLIAVIAVPTVKKIVDDAKLKAFEETARGIIRAGNLYYSKEEMIGEELVQTKFSFPNEADDLKLSGKLPKSGSMVINADGEIALAISDGKYCITKSYKEKDITTTKNFDTCEIPLGLGDYIYFNPVLNQKCMDYVEANSDLGVTDGCLKWYVYKETDESYGLILDHNTTAGVNWNDTATPTDGPVALMAQLASDTSNWTVTADVISGEDLLNTIPWYSNLEDKTDWLMKYQEEGETIFNSILDSIDYNDYPTNLDYQKEIKARLMEEAEEYMLPIYLHDDLFDYCDSAGICTTSGYWSKDIYASNLAYGVISLGNVDLTYITPISRTQITTYYGVRPVITLSKLID